MKKFIIHLCLTVGLGGAFTSCSDFLDLPGTERSVYVSVG